MYSFCLSLRIIVVPHAGTWIEIWNRSFQDQVRAVVPHAGTWIEMYPPTTAHKHIKSFPTRERGLKLHVYWRTGKSCNRRSPRGNVDWNPPELERALDLYVVPHAGTWIEISFHIPGLHRLLRRSPRGNVDWNQTKMAAASITTGRSPRGNVDWN